MTRHLSNRDIVLGVTGSIAAYKACDLASCLVRLGAHVTVALTRNALEFVGRASFEAITGRRAIAGMFEPIPTPEIEHISVAARAGLFLIAPATANILAKAAHGIADDWLSTTLLATRAPILFAPAMNANMYTHPATQANIALLRQRGCHFVGPEEGHLACGTQGIGRMIDPLAIIEAAIPLLSPIHDLAGKRVLITSGGTREPIDPVRYIGNRSSGKMGRALALEALARGAQVHMIAGPSEAAPPHGAAVTVIETASDMARACESALAEADVFIAAAAVADYRAAEPAPAKRKKTGDAVTLTLIENPDVLASAGARKRPGQIIVGFAAETEDLDANAAAKLERKKCDLMVANLVNQPDSGFGADTLRAKILSRSGEIEDLSLVTKDNLATRIFDRIAALLAAQ